MDDFDAATATVFWLLSAWALIIGAWALILRHERKRDRELVEEQAQHEPQHEDIWP